jgi:hypothetical protein
VIENLPWRTGRKVGRTVYAVTNEEGDLLIGTMDTALLAEEVVKSHNQCLIQTLGGGAQAAAHVWSQSDHYNAQPMTVASGPEPPAPEPERTKTRWPEDVHWIKEWINHGCVPTEYLLRELRLWVADLESVPG